MGCTVHQLLVAGMLSYTSFYINCVLYPWFTPAFLPLLQFHLILLWVLLLVTAPGSPSPSDKKLINRVYDSILNETEVSLAERKFVDFFDANRWMYQTSQGLVKSSRYCKVCGHYKLPRMHHSAVLNRCVYRMDHHCLLVNNCVGYRNYHIFIQFTVLTLVVSRSPYLSGAIGDTDRDL